ncbi:MAG: hypothetical protein KC657_03745 [Myxococcales bacterium]|nr:hypothetical protein [Myxococcales bacterium]
MRARLPIIALVALTVSACAGKKKVAKEAEGPSSWEPSSAWSGAGESEAAAAPGKSDGPKEDNGPKLPPPFTAEQIRAATKLGRTFKYRVEGGGEKKERVLTFTKVDDAGAEIYTGGDRPTKRIGWIVLQKHMEFPQDHATTHEEVTKTPAGKFNCVVYTVTGDDDEISTYHFAKELPGPPVLFFVSKGGKRLRTNTLIAHIPGK